MDGRAEPRSSQAFSAAIAEEIGRGLRFLFEDGYGVPVSAVHVSFHERFVAVVREIELTVAEHALIRAGRGDAVSNARQQFVESIGPSCRAIVERATGRRVEAFASRLSVEEGAAPWSADVFRLSETPVSGG